MQRLANLVILFWLIPLATFSQNLVSSESWTVGSGPVGIFGVNGSSNENIREIGESPNGQQAILWKAVPDASGNASGGWNTEWFSIDRTKMYRFSVWVKKTNSNDGETYFGCYSNNTLTLVGDLGTNPYFWHRDLPALNKWYLLVGYIHACNDPSTIHYGGVYDGDTGDKVFSITDYRFSQSATSAVHRFYLYYDVSTNDRQYFYAPQVYEVEAGQPFDESNWFTGNAFFTDKVGIGTARPVGLLEIKGPYTGISQLIINSTNSNAELRFSENDVVKGFVLYEKDNDLMAFGKGNISNSVIVKSSGNVGIGTPLPTEKFAVNGTIYGREVRVALCSWPRLCI